METAPALVAISDFVRELRAVSEAGFTLERVQRFLREHPVMPETLEAYLVWDAQHYTRNLIDKTDLYELLAICWEPGQTSAVHNHDGQLCWMAAPIGRLMVENYRVLESDEERGLCRLGPADKVLMEPNRPSAVDPAEPVHRVYNPHEFGQRAVSLHIYSRPFDHCLVYSPEHGKYGRIELAYHSRYGQLV